MCDLVWSSDDKTRLAVVDKSRLVLFDNLSVDKEHAKSMRSSSLVHFSALEVVTFNLERLLATPTQPSLDLHCQRFPASALCSLQQAEALNSAYQLVLKQMRWADALKFYLKSKDYRSASQAA